MCILTIRMSCKTESTTLELDTLKVTPPLRLATKKIMGIIVCAQIMFGLKLNFAKWHTTMNPTYMDEMFGMVVQISSKSYFPSQVLKK